MAAPTSYTRGIFQVDARAVPIGNFVQGRSLIRTPAGPSASTTAGMPKRSIGWVVPAAPGTYSEVYPTPSNCLLRAPTIRAAFSSSVRSETISGILSFVSLTDCACSAKQASSANGIMVVLLILSVVFTSGAERPRGSGCGQGRRGGGWLCGLCASLGCLLRRG